MMSYLLEILGRGLLAELAAAFRDLLGDDEQLSTRELERCAEGEPECSEHRRKLGIRYLTEHQYGRARDVFLEALQLDPADRVSRIGLACTLDELGLTRGAAEQLRTTLEYHPDDGAIWFALGFCQEKSGDTEDAIASYESALDVALQLRNAHERLAAIYLKLDNVDMAIVHYEHVCWCEPDDLTAGLTLANLYVRARRYEDAIRRYEFVITIEPDNWEAQDELVTTCIEAGRLEDGLEVLTGLIERRPECADQRLQLGDLYAKMGQSDRALDAYQKAVELNPDYLEATIKVGTAHLRSGRYTAAAGAFNRAIEINDRIVNSYVGLGVAQQGLGNHEDARASFEMAAEIEPNSSLLFNEMARLHLRVSAVEQAQRHLSPQTIARAPNEPKGKEASPLIQGQIRRLRTALHKRSNYADLHYRLGLLLRHEGDLDEAITVFQKAVEINPRYVKALTKLGLSLREAGQMEAATDAFNRALEVDPESVELHYQLGLIFADRNQFARALERFEYAAGKEPQNPDYVANLALALQNMGLIDRAEAGWQTLSEVARETSQVSELLRP